MSRARGARPARPPPVPVSPAGAGALPAAATPLRSRGSSSVAGPPGVDRAAPLAWLRPDVTVSRPPEPLPRGGPASVAMSSLLGSAPFATDPPPDAPPPSGTVLPSLVGAGLCGGPDVPRRPVASRGRTACHGPSGRGGRTAHGRLAVRGGSVCAAVCAAAEMRENRCRAGEPGYHGPAYRTVTDRRPGPFPAHRRGPPHPPSRRAPGCRCSPRAGAGPAPAGAGRRGYAAGSGERWHRPGRPR